MNYAIYSINALTAALNPAAGLLLSLLRLLPSGR
jgi:hypothetical protein